MHYSIDAAVPAVAQIGHVRVARAVLEPRRRRVVLDDEVVPVEDPDVPVRPDLGHDRGGPLVVALAPREDRTIQITTAHTDDIVRIGLDQVSPDAVSGWSAYPRQLDFQRFRDICDEVGALLFVDMAHFAGLVAAGEHPNPVPHADVVSTTIHKTIGASKPS